MPDRGCDRCGDRAGHPDPIADAACAYRHATTAAIRDQATDLDVDPTAATDLLAHLRSTFRDPEAYAATRYVLDLGWRPVIGHA